MFNSFYKGKKVFVTGHTGFKGSWLTLWLTYLGAKVKGYALEPYTADDHFVAAGLDKNIESVIADVRDYDKLAKELIEFRPDVVFHLAAQPLVRESYVKPRETYEINVMGTVNILEVVRKVDCVISCINVTSDKCYENVEKKEGYKEEEPMGGYDPYSSSKGCSELVTKAYRQSFFKDARIKIASARAGNVIGGGDWCKDRIVTDSINHLMNNKPIPVRNPNATRPWQYVLEPLGGYLWLGANRAEGAWNFGPDTKDLVTVKNVVDKIIGYWGEGKWQDCSDPNAPHEANLLQLDCTKAKKELEWMPVLDTDGSVGMTVNWYKNYAINKTNIFEYSLSQLEEYIKKAEEKNIVWVKK